MFGKTWMLLGLGLISGLPLMAAPAPAPIHVVVTVVNKHVDPAQPVAGVRVTIDFVDGSQKITEARDRTNSQGQTELIISPEAQQRGDLHVEISDAPNLVIYQPSEGILIDVHPSLIIVLLPKGSPALLQPAQIEAMLSRLSRLSIQNQQLQISLNKAEHQKPDFDQLLRNWASTNGLPYDQVDQQMRAWANDVLEHREEASLTKQAEAELALRHYENAAKLFQGAAITSKQTLHREQEDYLVGRRAALRSLFKESTQAADAFQLARQYHQATLVMDDAVKETAAEHQRYPEDIALRHIWFRAVRYTSIVRTEEGEKAAAQESPAETPKALYSKALDDSKSLLAQIDKSAEPEQWASTQFEIASASFFLGVQEHDKEAAGFRSQAIASARAAVDASNKQKNPKEWAEYASYYSLILAMTSVYDVRQGNISSEQATESLSQSVEELHSVVEIHSHYQDPLEVARTQMLIGNLLTVESMLSPKGASEFLTQAEASIRTALEAVKKSDHPDDWSMAERALGNVLCARADTKSGNQEHDLMLQCATAIQDSLQVSAKLDDPLDWASTEHELAHVLYAQSKDFSGNQAIDLLNPSIAALRFELQVITKTSAPLRWARIQYQLGSVLAQLTDIYNGQAQASQAAETRSQAGDAFRAALEVLNRKNDPDPWARTQWALGSVLFAQSQTTTGNQSTDLLSQAAAAFSQALEVITAQAAPQDWASMQNTLGHIRAAQGVRSSGQRATDFFTQSAEAFTAALQVAPKKPDTLALLSSIYHDNLLDFAKAYDYATRAEAAAPNDSSKLNLAEAALTTSRFSICIDLINSINQSQLDPQLTHGRLTLLLACQWGAGQHTAASQTAETLAASASTVAKQSWSTSGDRVYLAAAPEFSATRPLWIKLFQSLEQGDGASLADAAHTIHQGAGN